MPNILIVDDFSIVRSGIKETLRLIADIHFSEAACAHEAIEFLKVRPIDLIILDINMPGMNGLELLTALHRDRPNIKVLVLSMQSTERYALQIMRVGAYGYLQKDAPAHELIEAVNKILAGKKHVTSLVASVLLKEASSKETAPHLSLTKRESEIFRQVCRGARATDIAELLGISIKTVSTYKIRILEKMNMKSDSDLIYYSVKQNLLTQDDLYMSCILRS